MFGTGLATGCAAIAWFIAFAKLITIGAPDPFGFVGWHARALLVGGGLLGCLAVARYATYRPGRGLRLGLANFLLLAGVLVTFFSLLFFVRQGGDLTNGDQLLAFAGRVLETYGVCAFASLAAFLASDVLLARL